MLSARQIRSGHPQNAKVRTRLNELVKITERNVREKLNLGQPWSWYLIPRLELLVDAGILQKKERHGLTGYSLTAAGHKYRSVCDPNESGEVLIRNYFFCRDARDRPVTKYIEWKDIENRLGTVAPELKTSVGYFPIFETASALCVSQFLKSESSDEPIWELDEVKERLWEESKSSTPRVRLAINRQGHILCVQADGNHINPSLHCGRSRARVDPPGRPRWRRSLGAASHPLPKTVRPISASICGTQDKPLPARRDRRCREARCCV